MRTTLSRRKFMQLTGASTVLLAIGCTPGRGGEVISNVSDAEKFDLNQFVTIDANGNVTLFNHRPEMGQGTFQSIPMILAEELEVDMNAVTIEQSMANQELYGRQMVVGSHSIQNEYAKLRKMGATAREMLKQAAANEWNVPVSECTAKNGAVIHSSGKKLGYGELVAAAAKLPAPADPTLKAVSDFSVIGTSYPRQDIPLKTNGSAKYGIDFTVPNMLYASIERSPVFLGKVISYNEEEVLSVPGVTHVLKTSRNVFGRNREGVAVLAESYWAASQGRKKLRVQWDEEGLNTMTTEALFADYRKASKRKGDVLFEKGSTEGVLSKAEEVVEATYEMPYQAHVPMEPMNAIASVTDNAAEFWGSTQNPNGIRSFLSRMLSIPEDNIRINYTLMGGGFGRRSLTDIAEEAADLSRQSGRPVKSIWTREDDQTQGPFRAASLNTLRGVLDGKGNVVALEHKVVSQEIRNQTGDNKNAGRQLMGGVNTEYNIPNLSVKGVLQKHYVPISYWRAVYHSTNPFAHESFIDELASKVGKDPLDFRLAMMQDHPRFKRVLEETRTLTNWGSKQTGIGRGLAISERSGAHFAMVVDVRQEGNSVRPVKITTVLDLGICIHPNTVKAQTEGSIIMGLSACMSGLNLSKGRIVEQNWDRYPLLNISQCPEIVTHILQSDADPDGAGESGLPTVAPALANAIFDLTGQRIRKLPMEPLST